MDVNQVLSEFEQNLFLPRELISCEKEQERYRFTVKYGIVSDALVLICGCIISQALYEELKRDYQNEACCPICQKLPLSSIGPVKPLRTLYDQLQYFKREQAELVEAAPTQDTKSESQQQNLISLFHSVASEVGDSNEFEATEVHSLDNVSNTRTMPIQDSSSTSVPIAITESPPSVQLSQLDEKKEFYFAKCFPMYRKRTQYNTHSRFLRTKSRQFINTAISPDCTKFALITEHKWEVYQISRYRKRDGQNKEKDFAKKLGKYAQNKKDRSESSECVELLFCGKVSGEYGPSFDELSLPEDLDSLIPLSGKQRKSSQSSIDDHSNTWEHLYCKLSNELLVISGSKGHFRVFDLNNGGVPLYTYASSFPIRCIEIDPKSTIIACGITGSDRVSGAEQALILFHQIEKDIITQTSVNSEVARYKFSPPITTTLPYRDPINTLQFSPDSAYISCSTALESRFLVISLRRIHEPRLVMKSLRSIDTSLESEGITDTKMFPGNSNLMCVTSVAFNAPPIVINTKIQTINGMQSVAQPTMLLRLDELGSKIHKCEISPRNDSIAFLDRNGTVYIMYAPTLLDNEKRRIVSVEVAANAYRMREAASLRFSADGHKLFILDRKGIIYIEDFAYGLPQDEEVTKCKQIN
ncbi:SPS-sensor component PTR3 [Lachancea thermotolerans]